MDFNQATEAVNALSVKPDDNTLLKLYGLYKQAKQGNCTTARPWAWDIKGCAKWDAWNNFKGKSEDWAKVSYTKLVEKLLHEDVARLQKDQFKNIL